MKCVTCWRPCRKLPLRKRMGWEQAVSEFNKITGSAAAKPFTTPTFTLYLRLEDRHRELPRQGESCRRRNIKRSPRSCARPGRNRISVARFPDSVQARKRGVRSYNGPEITTDENGIIARERYGDRNLTGMGTNHRSFL